MIKLLKISALLICLFVSSCNKESIDKPLDDIQLLSVRVGTFTLDISDGTQNINMPSDKPIVMSFSTILAVATVEASIRLKSKID